MDKFFTERKGQSAIEYLTTYGWMLLVIAIVGGAIFTTVQNSAQLQESSMPSGSDVDIVNFGVTGDTLDVEIRASAQDQVENINITLYQENGDYKDWSADSDSELVTLPVGETETVTFDDITSSENSNSFIVEAKYTVGNLGDGGSKLTTNGSLQGNLAHVNAVN
jgi:hypothetical protein